MRYETVCRATFLERPNRFIAHCMLNGAPVTAHVPNTGRCAELLVPGCTVWLVPGQNPARKTHWTLVSVEKGGLFINMDSGAPNRIAAEALRSREGAQDARERPPANREQTDRFRDAIDHARQGVQQHFVERLRAAGIPTTVRDTRGRDIDGACGQLAATV